MNNSPAAIMAFYYIPKYITNGCVTTNEYWVPLRPGCHLTLVPSDFSAIRIWCHQILVPSDFGAISVECHTREGATNARVPHTKCSTRIGALPATVTW